MRPVAELGRRNAIASIRGRFSRPDPERIRFDCHREWLAAGWTF